MPVFIGYYDDFIENWPGSHGWVTWPAGRPRLAYAGRLMAATCLRAMAEGLAATKLGS